MLLILFAFIGLAVGWIAGVTLEHRGLGPGGDILVGVLGALVGGLSIITFTDIAFGLPTQALIALLGALIALGLASFVKNDRPIIHV